MRWKGRRQSSRIEDRRRQGKPRGKAAVGGLGTIVLVLAVSYFTGTNPLELLQVMGTEQASVGPGPSGVEGPPRPAAENEQAQLVSVVLADLEDTWAEIFSRENLRYVPPNMVLFTDAVQSACGFNSAAVGPFYCPGDQKVYLDLGFFRQLENRFGAPGDFAQAYVVAHEVGHHVQNALGISEQVHRAQSQRSKAEANELSVRLELQADCLAGVWGYYANRQGNMLEPGDVNEGLAAAQAIGDDTLQRQAGGAIRPESWTHGSSEDRARWLRRGLDSGDIEACDTFADARL
jgi:predicted metalloprotease